MYSAKTLDVQCKNTIRTFKYNKKKEHKSIIEKKSIYIYIYIFQRVHIEQTKSTVTFTYLPNKCHNIFTKYLFLVVVGHNFIFYYFILTYKKLTPQ